MTGRQAASAVEPSAVKGAVSWRSARDRVGRFAVLADCSARGEKAPARAALSAIAGRKPDDSRPLFAPLAGRRLRVGSKLAAMRQRLIPPTASDAREPGAA